MEAIDMSKITLNVPERTEPLVLDCQLNGSQYAITVGDTVYEGSLVLTGPGEGWLNTSGRILPFYMTLKQDVLSVWMDGRTYSLNLVTGSSRRAGGAGAAALTDGEIKAPMPGTVLKVPVKTGDAVEANQALVIMESMKMEMTLSAPQAATVKAVSCSEGQLVEMGAVLIKLEPIA
jgi:3-methylcrotonyl-CoA carboxylase alpha subunit